MKRTLLLATAFLMLTGILQAQVTVTVVPVSGNQQQHLIDATGGIYINNDNMIVVTSTDNGTSASYALDEVRKVLFSGSVRITDISARTPLSISPNPAAGSICIMGLDDGEQELAIYTLSGAEVLRGTCRNGEPVDIKALPAGVYIVKTGMNFGKMIKR